MSLERLLRDVSGAGTHHSEGCFTLNLSQAFLKSRRYGSSPYDFVLRAVQAGVAAGAEAIRIDCGRSKLSICFEAEMGSLAALLTWISGSQERPSRPQRHLASALLAAPPVWQLILSDGSVQRRNDDFDYSDHRGNGMSWSLPSNTLDLKALRAHLRERTRHSPVPVYLDGASTLGPWTAGEQSGAFGDNVDLVASFTSGSGLALPEPAWRETSPIDERWRLWNGCRGWFTRGTSFPARRPCWLSRIEPADGCQSFPWRLARAVRRPLYGPAQGSVIFVLDGVTSTPQPLPQMPGLEVLEHASWAQTDLFGLEVVHDEAYEAFIEELRGIAEFLDEALARYYDRLQPTRRGKARGPDAEFSRHLLIKALERQHPGFSTLEEMGEPPPTGAGRAYTALGYLLKNRTVSTYLAWCANRQRLVVLHTVRSEKQLELNLERYLQRGESPLLLSPLEHFEHEDRFHIVFPYQMGTSFHVALSRQDNATKLQLLAQLVRALETLHQVRGHGGLTPGRVLLTPEREIRFLSNLMETLEISPSPLAPQEWPARSVWQYASPERISGRPPDQRKSDLFSLGLILFTTLGGGFSVEDNSPDLIVRFHARTTFRTPDVDTVLRHLTPELRDAIAALLAPRPEERHADMPFLASLLEEEAWRAGSKERS